MSTDPEDGPFVEFDSAFTQPAKNQELLWAVKNNRRLIRRLVAAGADPNCALHEAASDPDYPALVMLLDLGARPTQNTQLQTPLHLCAGRNPHAEYLLERFPEIVNIPDSTGLAPTFLATEATFHAFAAAYGLLGADLRVRHPDGRTLLWFAPPNWAGALLAAGVVPDPDILLRTPTLSHSDIVALLRAGANPNVANVHGDTPLQLMLSHTARRRSGVVQGQEPGDSQKVRLLLGGGASPLAKDDNGTTLLHWADQPVLVRDLHAAAVKIGAEPDAFLNALNNAGGAPIHLVVSVGVVKQLVALGANPNIQDTGGNTPLHLAAAEARSDIVEFLLGIGAATDIQNNKGETPLDVARLARDKYQQHYMESTVINMIATLERTVNPSVSAKAAAKKK